MRRRGLSRTVVRRRARQRQHHVQRERDRRQHAPDDPPRSRTEPFQQKRRGQAGDEDADAGTGVEQAPSGSRDAADAPARCWWQVPMRRQTQPRRQNPTGIAPCSARRRWPTSTAPASRRRPRCRSEPRGTSRSAARSGSRPARRKVAGGIGRVHEACGRIGPVRGSRACPAAAANRRSGTARRRRPAPAPARGSAARPALATIAI